jgi:Phosphodiester glycosidase
MLERTLGLGPPRRRRVIHALTGLLVLCVSIVVLAPGSAAVRSRADWARSREIAPGVVFTKIKDSKGPWRIFILSIETEQVSTLDTVLANDRLPGVERTSSMAARSGAIAAINGDYATSSGRPVYSFAHDGFLDQSPASWGRNFSVDTSETLAYIGHPLVSAWALDSVTGLVYSIERVNQGAPAFDEVAMYSAVGGSEERPPQNACSVRLFPVESPRRRTSDPGVDAVHYVDKVKCTTSRMQRRGGIVLATPLTGSRTAEISSLVVGQQMTLSWTLGWDGVFDTIGGNPVLVRNGNINYKDVRGDTPFHRRNPRTAVGTTADGRVLFVAVDGRQPGYSVGMSLERLAELLVERGAVWALNLDGGGSTTFVVEGDIKNRPSDGPERPVSSSLVLLPGPDSGEIPSAAAPDAAASAPWGRIAGDPGSTGGLAAYVRSESGRVPAVLRPALREFAAP